MEHHLSLYLVQCECTREMLRTLISDSVVAQFQCSERLKWIVARDRREHGLFLTLFTLRASASCCAPRSPMPLLLKSRVVNLWSKIKRAVRTGSRECGFFSALFRSRVSAGRWTARLRISLLLRYITMNVCIEERGRKSITGNEGKRHNSVGYGPRKKWSCFKLAPFMEFTKMYHLHAKNEAQSHTPRKIFRGKEHLTHDSQCSVPRYRRPF